MFFIVLVGGGLFWTGDLSIDLSNDAPITINEYIIVFVMMGAGIAIIFVKSRTTAIIIEWSSWLFNCHFLCSIPGTGFGLDANYRRNSDDSFILLMLLFLT